MILDCHSCALFGQVRGRVPLCGEISSNTRNEVDGGTQCSVDGPDKWNIGTIAFEKGRNVSLNDLPLVVPALSGYEDLFPSRERGNRKKQGRNRGRGRLRPKQRQMQRTLYNALKDDVTLSWMKRPSRLPDKTHLALNVIVESSDGSPLSPSDAKVVPCQYKNFLNVGSVFSAEDLRNNLQMFHQLTKTNYDILLKDQDRSGGFCIRNESEIDDIISNYSSGQTTELLSTDKMVRTLNPQCEGKFNGYVRVFAGVPSTTFKCPLFVTNDVENVRITSTFSNCREHTELIPLTCGFFQSTFHRYDYNHDVIERFNKSVGSARRGLFDTRSCMKIAGSCSYLGPRKGRGVTLNRPNVSEGPKEPINDRSENRWWHRKQINPAFWPYTVSLMNVMIGPATLAAYYIYAHMARLYESCNSTKSWCKFCPSVIMTVDFACSCHIDRNDKEDHTSSLMITKLRTIIDKLNMLESKGVAFERQRKAEALSSLKHLLYWGFCIPTTCCYQYIFGKEERKPRIRIYQWFMCPGLGTTHLIKNYWVHMMLAGLFSHCTSVPIYIVDDSVVYFGSCPHVTMLAWGGL